MGVGICGIQGKEGYTQLCIESFLSLIMARIQASVMLVSALPGEIFMNDANQEMAKQLGNALFGTSIPNNAPSCPLCGSTTFRFLEQGRVRCMLCSNTGTMAVESGRPTFHIEKDEHGLFLSREEALSHREWLREEVRRFNEMRDTLKEIRSHFKDKGAWLKPK